MIGLGIHPHTYHKTSIVVGKGITCSLIHPPFPLFQVSSRQCTSVYFLPHTTPLKRLSAVVLAIRGCCVADRRLTQVRQRPQSRQTRRRQDSDADDTLLKNSSVFESRIQSTKYRTSQEVVRKIKILFTTYGQHNGFFESLTPSPHSIGGECEEVRRIGTLRWSTGHFGYR